jgi:molybdopterin biosynthesis enzyme
VILAQARSRVLARDVLTPVDVPGFDRGRPKSGGYWWATRPASRVGGAAKAGRSRSTSLTAFVLPHVLGGLSKAYHNLKKY